MSIIMDGKALAEKRLELCREAAAGKEITLAVILVGDDPASAIYVRNKERACEKAGIKSSLLQFPASITQEELLKEVEKLNQDPAITGFIVQVPLPAHIEVPKVIRAIDPKKDADGFQAYNLGKMFLSTDFEHLPPATPKGIITLLEEYKIPIQGQEVVVVGHSNTVGKPISTMLLNRNATVTTCHIHTKDLASHTRRADILIVAAGVPKLITADMVQEGVTIIDVGINKTEEGIVGDVDFDSVSTKASHITPVPGGVGPMTVASLIENTIAIFQRSERKT